MTFNFLDSLLKILILCWKYKRQGSSLILWDVSLLDSVSFAIQKLFNFTYLLILALFPKQPIYSENPYHPLYLEVYFLLFCLAGLLFEVFCWGPWSNLICGFFYMLIQFFWHHLMKMLSLFYVFGIFLKKSVAVVNWSCTLFSLLLFHMCVFCQHCAVLVLWLCSITWNGVCEQSCSRPLWLFTVSFAAMWVLRFVVVFYEEHCWNFDCDCIQPVVCFW